MPIVTLTTDFGLDDPYVGQVKGVILSLCPEATLVDLSHHIPAQDVMRAAVVVAESHRYFPAGTIHLAVVDPGVGTQRRALVVEARDQLFIAPDNGLLTLVLSGLDIEAGEVEIHVISETKYLNRNISPTFHGRDVFAPAAGHLANGLNPAELGPKVNDPVLLDLLKPEKSVKKITGRVLYVDHFGNLITNIPAADILDRHRGRVPTIRLAGHTLTGLHVTYAEVEPGQPLALIGSLELLEISVNLGRADEFFDAGQGEPVEVSW